VADWLVQKHAARIVVIGGKGEEALGDEIVRELGHRGINTAGRTTLRQAAALMQRCALYVGNDTGPMHLAAAAGLRVVEISCHPRDGSRAHPQSPARFGPWRVPHAILQPHAPTAPCTNTCIAEAPHCILNVQVDSVKDAVERLLGCRTSTSALPIV